MIANTIIKALDASYQTIADKYGNLWINNIQNTLRNTHPKNLNFRIIDPQIRATAKLFNLALGQSRIQALYNKNEWLATNYFLSPEGKILEIEFCTKADTSLKIIELETLENLLINNLTLAIIWGDGAEANFAPISAGVTYQTILEIHDNKGLTGKSFTISTALEVPPSDIFR